MSIRPIAGSIVLLVAVLAHSQNPVPLLNQPLVPDAVAPGAQAFTLTLNGTGFVPGAGVAWNGEARPTRFISGSQLEASISASDVANAGTATVTVVNPGPGGGTSNFRFFEVTLPSGQVHLASYERSAGIRADYQHVETADINGDGKMDIVVAGEIDLEEQRNGALAVVLNKGGGKFHVGEGHYILRSPFDFVAADFNKDGRTDLAIPDFAFNVTQVFLGLGHARFQDALRFSNGFEPVAVTTADFNQDGNLDLAAVASDGVWILLGNGDGTFQPSTQYVVGEFPFGVAVGDFNGDGNIDVVNAASQGLSMLLGNGDGTFQPYFIVAPDLLGRLTAADFNGDGKLDIAGTDVTQVIVYLGNGDGSFQPGMAFKADNSANDIVTADFNGDGTLDLATANADSLTASIFPGNGDGTFQRRTDYDVPDEPLTIASADFDGDGKPDLVIGAIIGSTVRVLLQQKQ